MTEEELAAWYYYFDQNKNKFKWFFDLFADDRWTPLVMARIAEDQNKMLSIMNGVWFDLPDRFNICDDPPGWKEFLYLIEL